MKGIYIDLCILGLCVLMILCQVIWHIKKSPVYYYIDWDNQIGVATKCKDNKEGLICERSYRGTVSVKEYWKVYY